MTDTPSQGFTASKVVPGDSDANARCRHRPGGGEADLLLVWQDSGEGIYPVVGAVSGRLLELEAGE